MSENPYEPSHVQASPKPAASSGSRRVRMSVFGVNCLLLALFPPVC